VGACAPGTHARGLSVLVADAGLRQQQLGACVRSTVQSVRFFASLWHARRVTRAGSALPFQHRRTNALQRYRYAVRHYCNPALARTSQRCDGATRLQSTRRCPAGTVVPQRSQTICGVRLAAYGVSLTANFVLPPV